MRLLMTAALLAAAPTTAQTPVPSVQVAGELAVLPPSEDHRAMADETAMGAMDAHAGRTNRFTLVEELDFTRFDGEAAVNWEAQGWIGGDRNKFWWRTEGETKGPRIEQGELQALYSRNVWAFFDVQTGVRYDFQPDSRGYWVVGVQGLAPGFLETEAHVFVGFRGDALIRLRQSFDLRMTNRLVVQPQFETDIYLTHVPERLIGPGVAIVETGLFTRYEITRKFAPYVALVFERRVGESARLATEAGEDKGGWSVRGGVRFWF